MTARAGRPKKKLETARILHSLAPGTGKFPELCLSESGEQTVPSLTVWGQSCYIPPRNPGRYSGGYLKCICIVVTREKVASSTLTSAVGHRAHRWTASSVSGSNGALCEEIPTSEWLDCMKTLAPDIRAICCNKALKKHDICNYPNRFYSPIKAPLS